MSQHFDKGNGNGGNGNGDDYSDASLSELYRQTRREQPPQHVDAAILALAKQHVEKHLHAVSPFSARWPVSASMVAVLVLAFGLITFMQWELGPEKISSMTVPAHTAGNVKKKDAATIDSLSDHPQENAAEPVIAETEMAGAAAPLRAKPAGPAAQEHAMRREEKLLAKPPARRDLSSTASQQRQLERKQLQSAPQASAQQKPMLEAMAKKSETAAAIAPAASEQDAMGMLDESAGREKSGAGVSRKAMPTAVSACRGELPAMTAQDYWLGYSRGTSSIVEQGRDTACVVIDTQGGREYRLIALTALQDRQVKQQAFITALDEAMTALAVKKLSTAQQQLYVRRMQRLTGLRYNAIGQWSDWYQANKSTLTLSADGQYLISQGNGGQRKN